eukprot:scaffold58174_cov47-Prasinocladus_malaysianus.AAC.1
MDHPGGPPEIRLGIAVCFYRKGDHARAQAAFERVLELDPKNVEALQGLAVMKLNSDYGENEIANPTIPFLVPTDKYWLRTRIQTFGFHTDSGRVVGW